MDELQLADYLLKRNRGRQKEIGEILITGGAKDFDFFCSDSCGINDGALFPFLPMEKPNNSNGITINPR